MNRFRLATLLLLLLVPAAAAQDNQSPVPGFTWTPVQPRPGEPVSFTSTSTDDVGIVNWTWSFGDGSLAYGENVSHTFAGPGDYLVQLTVVDEEGATGLREDLLAIPDPNVLPRWLLWAMPLLVAGLLLSLAWVVHQRGQGAVYNHVFVLLYATAGLGSLCQGLVFLVPGEGVASLFFEANRALSYLFAPLFLWLVLVFPRPAHPWLARGGRGALSLVLAVPFLANQFAGWLPSASASAGFTVLVHLVALACLGLLVHQGRHIDSYEERARLRYLAASFGLFVLSILLLSVLHALQPDASSQRAAVLVSLVIVPLLGVAGAMLLMYAILRFQVVGIQGLVTKIARGAVVAVMVPSTFIIVGNLVEEIFQTVVLEGVRFDFLIAGFVSAFAMVPVQKFTSYVLTKFFPEMTAQEESARRVQIYEAQLRYALLDGGLDEEEVTALRALAAEIQLQPEELSKVVATFPKADLRGLAAAATA